MSDSIHLVYRIYRYGPFSIRHIGNELYAYSFFSYKLDN